MSETILISTSLDIDNILLAEDYELKNAYPNPFNPITTISFSIPQSELVSINIYDINGYLVQNVKEGYYGAGNYSESIDGSSLTSGAYFIRLETDDYSITEKLMLVK